MNTKHDMMPRIVLRTLLTVIIGASGCSPDEALMVTPELLGEWKLAEQLIDPGDGSGTFQEVASDKSITFMAAGEYVSSGSLCDMSTGSDVSVSGTYDLDGMVILPDCEPINNSIPVQLPYKFEEGDLIIYYQCFEACAEKYTRVP